MKNGRGKSSKYFVLDCCCKEIDPKALRRQSYDHT